MYSEISFIVLCYNDAGGIERLIPDLDHVLRTNFNRYEIILINDCSTDHSLSVAMKLKNRFSNLTIISHYSNIGVGGCFRTGFENTKYNVVGYIDGDYQYEPKDMIIMMNHLNYFDAVSGIRVNRSDHWKRKVISAIYNYVINRFFDMNFIDVNSGLKIYKRDFFINGHSGTSIGAFYDAEILIRGIKNGKRIKEIPINHYYREYGVSGGAKLKTILFTCRELLNPEMVRFQSSKISARIIRILLTMIPNYGK